MVIEQEATSPQTLVGSQALIVVEPEVTYHQPLASSHSLALTLLTHEHLGPESH